MSGDAANTKSGMERLTEQREENSASDVQLPDELFN